MRDIQKAIRAYRRRRRLRLDARGISLIEFDYNDNHDKLGRFAPKPGGSIKTAEEMTAKDIKVHGPKEAKKYVESYLKANPGAKKQIMRDAKKYANALKKVKDFQKDNPNAEPGTYSMATGKKVDIDRGYCLTFHQNHKIGNEFGGYDDKTYAMMAAVAKHELGSDDVYVGFFGNPEISFNCKDYQKSKRYCIEHNQHSIYDAKTGKLWKNDYWDEKHNPIKGEGSHK